MLLTIIVVVFVVVITGVLSLRQWSLRRRDRVVLDRRHESFAVRMENARTDDLGEYIDVSGLSTTRPQLVQKPQLPTFAESVEIFKQQLERSGRARDEARPYDWQREQRRAFHEQRIRAGRAEDWPLTAKR